MRGLYKSMRLTHQQRIYLSTSLTEILNFKSTVKNYSENPRCHPSRRKQQLENSHPEAIEIVLIKLSSLSSPHSLFLS